jgi:hypothetical protein
MLVLDGGRYNQLIHLLYSSELVLRGNRGPLPITGSEILGSGATEIAAICRALGLETSAKTAELMLSRKNNSQDLHAAFLQLTNTVMVEMEGRKFYCPTEKFISYYENPKLFGDDVFDAFPSANDDIFEAGTCLALERPTACVMHLMRVLEVGLSALANVLNVSKQNDWGKYIKEINGELDRRLKTAGARTEEEQFYSEICLNFDQVRRAWRNPTMHPDKTYSQERAEEILLTVKSFMNHLSQKVFEF